MTAKDTNSPLGQAWRSHVTGQNDAAVDQFNNLASASPEDLDALYGLGLAQRGAGQYDQAIETFNKVLEILSGIKPQDENEQNRVQMLTRMTKQQLEFIEQDRA